MRLPLGAVTPALLTGDRSLGSLAGDVSFAFLSSDDKLSAAARSSKDFSSTATALALAFAWPLARDEPEDNDFFVRGVRGAPPRPAGRSAGTSLLSPTPPSDAEAMFLVSCFAYGLPAPTPPDLVVSLHRPNAFKAIVFNILTDDYLNRSSHFPLTSIL